MTASDPSAQALASPEPPGELPTEFDQIYDDLSARFQDAFGFRPFPDGRAAPFLRAARTDVHDLGAAYRIVAEVPGIPKEKIEIRVRGPVVEIRGEKAAEAEKTSGELVYRERRAAGYYRALELPEPVIAEQAKATVENGVLALDLPKLHPSPSPEGIRVPVA